jgi:hypothetical protein
MPWNSRAARLARVVMAVALLAASFAISVAPKPAAASAPPPPLPECSIEEYNAQGQCQPPDTGGADGEGSGVVVRSGDTFTFTFNYPASVGGETVQFDDPISCGSAGCIYWGIAWDYDTSAAYPASETSCSGSRGQATCTLVARGEGMPQGDSGERWHFARATLARGIFPVARSIFGFYVPPELYYLAIDGTHAPIYALRSGADAMASDCVSWAGYGANGYGWFPDRPSTDCIALAAPSPNVPYRAHYVPEGTWDLYAFDTAPATTSIRTTPTVWEPKTVTIDGNDLITTMTRQARPALQVSMTNSGPSPLPVGQHTTFTLTVKAEGGIAGDLRNLVLDPPQVQSSNRLEITSGPTPAPPAEGFTLQRGESRTFTYDGLAKRGNSDQASVRVHGENDVGQAVDATASSFVSIDGGIGKLSAALDITRPDGSPTGTISPGDELVAHVEVTNTGEGDVENVAVTDVHVDDDPDGLQITSQPSTTIASLAPGEERSLGDVAFTAMKRGTWWLNVSMQGEDPVEHFTIATGTARNVDVGCGGAGDGRCPLVVNVTGDQADPDVNDGRCDVDPDQDDDQCTLRAAIMEANARDGADDIMFDLTGADSTQVLVESALPTIADDVTIDGANADGNGGNAAVSGAQGAFDLLAAETPELTVRNLTLGNVSGWAVRGTGTDSVTVENVDFLNAGDHFSRPLPTIDTGGGAVRVDRGDLTVRGGSVDTDVVEDNGGDGWDALATAYGVVAANTGGGLGHVTVDGTTFDRVHVPVIAATDDDGSAAVLEAKHLDLRTTTAGIVASGVRLDGDDVQTGGAMGIVGVGLAEGSTLQRWTAASYNASRLVGGHLTISSSNVRSFNTSVVAFGTDLTVTNTTLDPDLGTAGGVVALYGSLRVEEVTANAGTAVMAWNADSLDVNGLHATASTRGIGIAAVGTREVDVSASDVRGFGVGLLVHAVADGFEGTLTGTETMPEAAPDTRADSDAEWQSTGVDVPDEPVPTIEPTATDLDVNTSTFANNKDGSDVFGDVTGKVGDSLDGGFPSALGNDITGNAYFGVQIVGAHLSVRGNTFSGNATDRAPVAIGGDRQGTDIVLAPENPPVPDPLVMPNDDLDVDDGANGLQNHPVLTSARTGDGLSWVQGELHSKPNTEYAVDLYTGDRCHPSTHGPLTAPWKSVRVTTDGNGDATFAVQDNGAMAISTPVSAIATGDEGTSAPSPCLRWERGAATMTAPAQPGDTEIAVDHTGFEIGDTVVVNPGSGNQETGRIVAFGSIVLDHPLVFAHDADEVIVKGEPVDAPVVQLLNPLPGGRYVQTQLVLVDLKATSPHGITKVELWSDGVPFAILPKQQDVWEARYRNNDVGQHVLTWKVTDGAGNVATGTFVVDVAPK